MEPSSGPYPDPDPDPTTTHPIAPHRLLLAPHPALLLEAFELLALNPQPLLLRYDPVRQRLCLDPLRLRRDGSLALRHNDGLEARARRELVLDL